MISVGIDPGQSGSISVLYPCGAPTYFIFKDATEMDTSNFFRGLEERPEKVFAMLERVNAFPGQGVSSTWKFGQHYGFLRGMLTAHRIPFELVTPRKWQAEMGCLTGGDKNISKAAAQRLYPKERITHANADSLLIATYCQRISFLSGEGLNG